MVCNTTNCRFGFETVMNPQIGEIKGSYRVFVEAFSFILFAAGVTLNTSILTVLITMYPNIDGFDGLLMNLSFGELLSSFGLAFVFFVQFTTSLAAIGDDGCRFLSWLDVTSVTITTTTAVALAYELHRIVYYSNASRQQNSRRKQMVCVLVTWLFASIPGLPYMATTKMVGRYCRISNWSNEAEIIYICAMFLYQFFIPVGAIMYFFTRITLALRMSAVGGTILNEETLQPGSESSNQRSMLKHRCTFLAVICAMIFTLIGVVSFMQLGLVLGLGDVLNNPTKFARIFELSVLLLCTKCAIMPLFYICFYNKLRGRITQCISRKRQNQDVYNTLRYDVYQQTVMEAGEQGALEGENGVTQQQQKQYIDTEDDLERANEEMNETERDDVAILG